MRIGGFQPFSLSDFPGKTAAIVFTQGCNFRCPYCHNRELWSLQGKAPLLVEDEVLAYLRRRVGQLDGVVLTGGEPTLQADLRSFILRLRSLGFLVKLDTNGCNPSLLEDLLSKNLIDFVAMDLKAPPEKYHILAGISVDVATVLCSVEILQHSKIPHLFRTTYDTRYLNEDDLAALKRLVEGSPYLVQACKIPS